MAKHDAQQVQVNSRAELRAWLHEHHEQADGIWLVVFKKHCGERYVAWGEIVAEALCFGWIDSQSRRVDDDRTSVWLSPRRSGSAWSAINKRLVEELGDQIMPAGRARIDEAKADGSWTFLDDVEARVVPPDLQSAIDTTEGAQAGWDAYPHGVQKRTLEWIKRAVRPATRASRIDATAAAAAEGRRLR